MAVCDRCQVPSVNGVCPDCGVVMQAVGEATGSSYAGSRCVFKQGAWLCRAWRWASKGEREFVLCDVHRAALRLEVKSLDRVYVVLLEIRAEMRQRQNPRNMSWPDGNGGWLYGWAPPDEWPGQPPAGHFIPFHWQSLEQCWKDLTGNDVLPVMPVQVDVEAEVVERVGAV